MLPSEPGAHARFAGAAVYGFRYQVYVCLELICFRVMRLLRQGKAAHYPSRTQPAACDEKDNPLVSEY